VPGYKVLVYGKRRVAKDGQEGAVFRVTYMVPLPRFPFTPLSSGLEGQARKKHKILYRGKEQGSIRHLKYRQQQAESSIAINGRPCTTVVPLLAPIDQHPSNSDGNPRHCLRRTSWAGQKPAVSSSPFRPPVRSVGGLYALCFPLLSSPSCVVTNFFAFFLSESVSLNRNTLAPLVVCREKWPSPACIPEENNSKIHATKKRERTDLRE
jgi:hypothetical protein